MAAWAYLNRDNLNFQLHAAFLPDKIGCSGLLASKVWLVMLGLAGTIRLTCNQDERKFVSSKEFAKSH